MDRQYELSDVQWQQIAPHLPGKQSDPGRTGRDNRLFVNAIQWLVQTGAPWRDLPGHFGKWNSVFQRYNRWCKNGAWQRIFEALSLKPDTDRLLLDSIAVCTYRGSIVGESRGAFGQSKVCGVGPVHQNLDDSEHLDNTSVPVDPQKMTQAMI